VADADGNLETRVAMSWPSTALNPYWEGTQPKVFLGVGVRVHFVYSPS
jgi:hypothetical protein